MTGQQLARQYYETLGRPALAAHFPALVPRMAVGLAGEGSECFGFDDALSRDHDWGAGFCIWLEEDDFRQYGAQVQAVYDSLPAEKAGFPIRRQQDEYSAGRVGCLCTQHWYRRYTGFPAGPETPAQWRRVPEAYLATVTNGTVFADPLGRFSAVREKLCAFYPEDVRLKKLAARAAAMAQAGQYNYLRCIKRGDMVAAQLARAEFMRAGMSMAYLLNRRYAPFYKWMHRGLEGLPVLPRAHEQFGQLARKPDGPRAAENIEGLCLTVAAELRRQGLSTVRDSFLLPHAAEILERITDPELRRTHVMEG